MSGEDRYDDEIAAIARDTGRSVSEARVAFEDAMAHLGTTAKITDYLVLFATRRARDRLVKKR
jgi:hypothetical protein